MSRFSDVAFEIVSKHRGAISSADLWRAMQSLAPDATEKTPTRKTPRTTAMRDIRKDRRFVVSRGTISLSELEVKGKG